MKLLLTTAILLPLASAIAFTSFRGTGAWENYKLLPQYELSSSLYSDADDIANDINNGRGEYFLDYKVKGGSSHQVFVKRRDGKVMGLWSAPNHATYIEGEIFAFTLSRLLNRSQFSQDSEEPGLQPRHHPELHEG